MRTLSLAFLIFAAPAAAEKKAAKRPASMRDLVAVTLKKGEASKLEDSMAAQLGYSSPPDIRDFIVLDTRETQLASVAVLDAKGSATELVLSSTTVTEWTNGEATAIDGYSFRANLSGRYITGVHAHGKVGAIIQDKVTDKKAKSFFEALRKAILAQPGINAL